MKGKISLALGLAVGVGLGTLLGPLAGASAGWQSVPADATFVEADATEADGSPIADTVMQANEQLNRIEPDLSL